VRFDLLLPQQCAGFGVDRVEPAGEIAEQQCVTTTCDWRHHDRGTHGTGRLEYPLEAAALRAHRVHEAAGAADEDLIVDHGRRRERRHVAREAERPFEFQLRHTIGGESCARGLKARVARRRAPPVPRGFGCCGEPHRSIGAEGGGRGSGIGGVSAEIRSYRDTLVAIHRHCDGEHCAGVERAQDARRGQALQGFAMRHALVHLLVTLRAMREIHGPAIRRRCAGLRVGRCGKAYGGRDDRERQSPAIDAEDACDAIHAFPREATPPCS
jgi:hypothetical protein